MREGSMRDWTGVGYDVDFESLARRGCELRNGCLNH